MKNVLNLRISSPIFFLAVLFLIQSVDSTRKYLILLIRYPRFLVLELTYSLTSRWSWTLRNIECFGGETNQLVNKNKNKNQMLSKCQLFVLLLISEQGIQVCTTRATSKYNFYRKIHYLKREFCVKLHAKTDIAGITKRWVRFQVQFKAEFMSQVMHFPWIA